ncbi:hypothetical protein BABINDRAFT_163896 [Babjeviella inositovora NRRL Y-12698]|uniref:AAA+ ATPase domain-containing protein n=1 Tax=Babjeviella inositovora NRRL Y-12698 TaxID=984486 RepID=A0A1E3QJ41_9ASCO|nr:uncharacterized protein BABINDRAFT_163896 [Babjeviella inositovora NRRL Y-12698]ODQ76997.1 hypothetical protein BABINDRAFT_163896 [Babjeviella inositovora NRRL Y-12698]
MAKLNLNNTSAKKKAPELPADKPEKPKKAAKVPKLFIVRPSKVTNAKSLTKVFLHPSTIKALELSTESLVQITKEGHDVGAVVGVLAGIDTEDDEEGIVQLSETHRRLGGFVLGDRIEIKRFREQPGYAQSVKIGLKSEMDPENLPPKARKSLAKILDGMGVIQPGMQTTTDIKISEEETSTITMFVLDIDYDMPDMANLTLSPPSEKSNLITPVFLFKQDALLTFTLETEISRQKYHLPHHISYASVGGLSQQIELLRSTIELPLHQPQLFSSFGISPPRGVLLHGPPGTGKTMLLRCVAFETNAHVLRINGPSIVSKYLGETEEALRDIFQEARKYQPSIIFIDEIDSLAPSRSSDDSGEVEGRVVATLLTLMDGMGDSGRLCVVAATNRPNSIDPALRRPGRFDQEVEVGIPDLEARGDIMLKQFAQMSQEKHELTAEMIYAVAAKTHGYVGADLVALVRESVMKAIKRGLLKGIDHTNMRVTYADVESALPEIRPSAMREIFLEMPKVYWDDIGGQHELKQKLREMVQLPLEAADTFVKLGVKAPKGLLLYGPPGCSKTLTAKALATESGINFLAVKGPEIFNKYVGESERAIREIFRKARAASPSIIFFDEIDALSPDRNDGGSTLAASHVLTSLLNEIDGVEELNGVVIVAATNRPDSIDPALLRPGRLDRHIYVSPPDFEARLQILRKCSAKFCLDPLEVRLEEYAERTEGCSGAEVALLVQEAGLAAVMEDQEAEKVVNKHFEYALSTISRGITPEMLEYYETFASRSGGL